MLTIYLYRNQFFDWCAAFVSLGTSCANEARSLAHAKEVQLVRLLRLFRLIFMEIDFSIAAFGAFVPLGASCAEELAL